MVTESYASPYRLTDDPGADSFYRAAESFADALLARWSGVFAAHIRAFARSPHYHHARSDGELLLDILIIGVMLERHGARAAAASLPTLCIMELLYQIRSRVRPLKAPADALRSHLMPLLLRDGVTPPLNGALLTRTMRWLNAGGEFREEARRIRLWRNYCRSLPLHECESLLGTAITFARDCAAHTDAYLSPWLGGIDRYASGRDADGRIREDYLLVSRRSAEYGLNIFGAVVMNRSMRKAFLAAPSRAVLLPLCMRANDDLRCRCARDAKGRYCVSCDARCPLGQAAAEAAQAGARSYLIPHSSDFSVFLRKWEGSSTALVGVACIANLLTGGLEMRRRGIHSTCVFLNAPVCAKHWSSGGETAALHRMQLRAVLTISGRDTPSVSH